MIDLPVDYTDPLTLADWLELSAVDAGDRNASAGDLRSALQVALGDWTGPELEIDAVDEVEHIAMAVMEEVRQRSGSAVDGYPFELRDGRVLELRDEEGSWLAYLFCLALSYFGWTQVANALVNPWFVFEELSCVAAEHYVQGNVFRVGAHPERDLPFPETVEHLCQCIGEGGGFRKQSTRKRDDKVDLVAWRDFPDQNESKMVMFGQCAAGADWEDKVDELQPDAFCDQWMRLQPVSPFIPSFYIPHRIPTEKWEYVSRRTGILFDRCRLAHWAGPTDHWSDGLAERCREWLESEGVMVPDA